MILISDIKDNGPTLQGQQDEQPQAVNAADKAIDKKKKELLRQKWEKTKQNIAERLKAKTQPQILASILGKNINMPKATENPENIDIDPNYDDSFDEQSPFANPRATFRAHELIESSSEESEVDRDDAPQSSLPTSSKQKTKPSIDEIGIHEFFYNRCA